MSDENLTDEELEVKAEEAELEKEKAKSLSEEHKAILETLVEEKLQSMKANVEKAYKARDEAQKEAAKLKASQKELDTKRLKDEGKHLEVASLRITELEEREKLLEERLVSVLRDRELDSALGSLEFRNDFARETAFKSILPELVQDEDGIWLHKSGASLPEYVKAFSKDPQKDFLFKPKNNNGSGLDPSKTPGGGGKRPTSLKGMSTEDLLKLAASGKLGSYTL